MPGDDGEFKDLRQALAELARRTDREKPYAFVGRRAERGHFQQRTEQLPPYDGGAGGTTLITGAPGAGKTALKDQAVADFKEAHPSAVEIKVPSDSDEPPHEGMRHFLRQVAHHLVASPDPSGPEGTTSTEVRGDVNAGFLKGGASEATMFDVFGNPATFQDVHAAAVQRGNGQPKFGPSSCLLVTMDEAQNVKPGTWPAHLLNQAHLQDELPIQVICTGLSDTEDAFDNAGISRPSDGYHLRLGSLTSKEASESVVNAVKPLEALGLDLGPGGRPLAECAARIAKESDGWPKHLHCYMKAMFQQLAAMPRPSMGLVDLMAVVEAGNKARLTYYDGRIRAGKTHETIVLALHDEASRKKVRRSQTAKVIGTALRALQKSDPDAAAEWESRYKGSTEKCFKDMLHAGLVALNAANVCFVPIPSLRTHVQGLVNSDECEGSEGTSPVTN